MVFYLVLTMPDAPYSSTPHLSASAHATNELHADAASPAQGSDACCVIHVPPILAS